MKVTTFSRAFPVGHPRQGDKTLFVEKVWKSLTTNLGYSEPSFFWEELPGLSGIIDLDAYSACAAKKHTIRGGKTAKVGDEFSPRVWQGLPYRTKQMQFAPPIKLVRVIDFEMDKIQRIYLDGKLFTDTKELAKNDGLGQSDFYDWFGTSGFSGQVRVWDQTNLIY